MYTNICKLCHIITYQFLPFTPTFCLYYSTIYYHIIPLLCIKSYTILYLIKVFSTSIIVYLFWYGLTSFILQGIPPLHKPIYLQFWKYLLITSNRTPSIQFAISTIYFQVFHYKSTLNFPIKNYSLLTTKLHLNFTHTPFPIKPKFHYQIHP